MTDPTKPVAWTSTSQLKRLDEQSTDHLMMWAENLRYGGDVPLYGPSLLSEYERVKARAKAAEADNKRLREASKAAYLGLLVLKTMCRKAGLQGGVEATDSALKELVEAMPQLPALSALRPIPSLEASRCE